MLMRLYFQHTLPKLFSILHPHSYYVIPPSLFLPALALGLLKWSQHLKELLLTVLSIISI
jgi:hypothetical protein